MRWQMRVVDEGAASRLAADASLPLPLARILAGRGITTAEAARAFLAPRISDLHDPLLMDEMGKATARLRQARERGEAVFLFGDYDVDGITSTAVMGKVLEALGFRYAFLHPDRGTEGYGFNSRGVRAARDIGAALIITLDCGTEAAAPVAEARRAGLDVIVIDHHLPKGDLPPATAVVNPKKERCPYPFGDLAAAGVVLKFARALVETLPVHLPWGELLQLAALGTIADVAPLRGENRIIAMLGLSALNRDPLPGIEALIRAAALDPGDIRARHLAFQLGPRLNAAGRVGSPADATGLLLERDMARCRTVAHALNRLNTRRQAIEKRITAEALLQLEQSGAAVQAKAIVVAGRDWHPGVIGIVAARILERYHRPTVVIALGEEEGHGSARSIPAFDLFGGLSRCRDLFSSFGGHRHAAGLTLPLRNIEPFRERFGAVAEELLSEEDLVPSLTVDCVLPLADVGPALLGLLGRLEPFGAGNPQPVIASERVRVAGAARAMGSHGEHLKFALVPPPSAANPIECVGWGMARRIGELSGGGPLDIAYAPRQGEWNGIRRTELILKDFKPSGGAG